MRRLICTFQILGCVHRIYLTRLDINRSIVLIVNVLQWPPATAQAYLELFL